jgi:hypothetical protein
MEIVRVLKALSASDGLSFFQGEGCKLETIFAQAYAVIRFKIAI